MNTQTHSYQLIRENRVIKYIDFELCRSTIKEKTNQENRNKRLGGQNYE